MTNIGNIQADAMNAVVMQIGDSNGLMKPSANLQRQVSKSRQDGLKTALAKFGLLRGEVIDAVRLESYSRALGEEFADDADTLQVMDRLVKSRRAEYEPKIPEMGDLLEIVRQVRRDRRQKAATDLRLAEVGQWKQQWERERAEDEANGGREITETEVRLNRILALAKKQPARMALAHNETLNPAA